MLPMKYHIWTEGCQMNVADSRRAAAALERLGYRYTALPDDADVIILNTCVVRQSAEDKAVGRLQSLKPFKKKNPDLVINLMGCMVGVRSDNPRLRQRFPQVDVFSPPSDFGPLLDFLTQREGRRITEQETGQRNAMLDGELVLPDYEKGQLITGFLSIILGCSHACTYCIIPSRRGRERSRPPEGILSEARSLVTQGVKEITLLGQIVDRYGVDNPHYPRLEGLLAQLNEIDGLERLRFLTSHPNYMSDALLDAVAALPKVMPHVEVPVQAGDDQVLANMRRGYTAEQYRRLVEKIRARIPGVSIGTDIIVGFPGETDAQYQHTYDLLRDLRLDVVHLARYSPRPGTISATRMPDDVPDEVKWARFRQLEDLQKGISEDIHKSRLDSVTEVLFEDRRKGLWRGRDPNNKIVFAECTAAGGVSDKANLLGRLGKVKIQWAGPWSMRGRLVVSPQ
jgi:tRNA-2-methylthio-N6-dimethylallyladenosine synthase